MRSVLIIGGVGLGVGLLVLNGVLPRRAGATAADHQSGPSRSGTLEMKYADYESEQALLVGDHERAQNEAAKAKRTPARPARSIETPEAKVVTPEPSHEPPANPESKPPEPESPAPTANAGADHVLWLGRNTITLDGSQSAGDGLRYAWTQTKGPQKLSIKNPTAVKTTATGLLPEGDAKCEDADYEFELTVTDAHGQEAVDRVRFTARTGPNLSVRPSAKREFAVRDGYLLAQYESWKTASGAELEMFELRSPVQLFVQQIGGDAKYEITMTESPEGYTYNVTIYFQQGRATSWVELFVDTPERVPALVRLGVNWE